MVRQKKKHSCNNKMVRQKKKHSCNNNYMKNMNDIYKNMNSGQRLQLYIIIFVLCISIGCFIYSGYLYYLTRHKDDYSMYKTKDDCQKAKSLSKYTSPFWYNNKCIADMNPLTDPKLFFFLGVGGLFAIFLAPPMD